MRHSSSQVALEVYAKAVTSEERETRTRIAALFMGTTSVTQAATCGLFGTQESRVLDLILVALLGSC